MSKLLPNLILGVIGIAFVITFIAGSTSPGLEIIRGGAITSDDGFAFDVTNVDHKMITITAAKINDRSDCKATPISFVGLGKMPLELKVGDKATFISSCRVIRIEVQTDTGSAEFSF